MNIICEGPDNSGKSTLAKMLFTYTGLPVFHSGGRERYPGEINERVTNALTKDDVIWDRHPAISQMIYINIHKKTPVDPDLLKAFYNQSHIIIYCRADPKRGFDGHQVRSNEDLNHVLEMQKNHRYVISLYDEWALKHAHIIYRIGDNVQRIITLLEGI